jgi:ribonuclease HI
MELQAAIEALKILPEGSQGILWTDSRVLLEIVHTKMMALKNNGWLRSRGQPVIDLDLVQALDELMTTRKLEWRWVRAHSGNKYNDYCEQLCRTAYR